MSQEIETVKGWIGLVLTIWPIAKALLSMAGVELPDLDMVSAGSQGVGAYLLATSMPLKRK